METLKETILLDKSTGEVKATDKPQWVKTFPRGNFYIQKLKKKLTFNSDFFKNAIEAFGSATLSKPSIDKNHEFKESYGDVLELEERNDGLYSRVKLNADGVELVKNRKYKYISPAFGEVIDCNEKTFPVKLEAPSLTNWPALEGALPEIQSQIALSKFNIATEYNTEMEAKEMAIITELAKTFGLADDSTEEVLLAKVKETADRLVVLEKDSTDKDSKIVELEKTINAEKVAKLEKEADEYIGSMIKLGKLVPSTQELDKEDYLKDKERFIKRMELTKAPDVPTIDMDKVIVDEGGKQTIEGVTLENADIDTMKKIGHDPKNAEDVKIYLEQKRKHKLGGTK